MVTMTVPTRQKLHRSKKYRRGIVCVRIGLLLLPLLLSLTVMQWKADSWDELLEQQHQQHQQHQQDNDLDRAKATLRPSTSTVAVHHMNEATAVSTLPMQAATKAPSSTVSPPPQRQAGPREDRKRKEDRCGPLKPDKPATGAFSSCEGQDYNNNNNTTTTPAFQSGFHDGTAVVSCVDVHYKIPSTAFSLAFPNSSRSHHNADTLLVGVMSSPHQRSRRDAIRATWGSPDHQQRYNLLVFFVVGGPWRSGDGVEQEYTEMGDILWVDRPDLYDDLTYKTGALLSAIQQHYGTGQQQQQHDDDDSPRYRAVLKTDDDIYWNMAELRKAFNNEASDADCYGNCIVGRTFPYRPYQRKDLDSYIQKFIIDKVDYPERCFPSYCFGWGYMVSSSFTSCLVQEMASLRFIRFEDVYVGLLAERCNVDLTNLQDYNQWQHGWTEQTWEVNMTGKIMQHPVRTVDDMQRRHDSVIL